MTIGKKLLILVSVNLAVAVILALMGYRGMRELTANQDRIVLSSKLLGNHMMIDMMHDGLRADVYGALLRALGSPAAATADEITADLDDHIQTIRSELAENMQMVRDADLKALLEEARPPLEAYVEAAQAITQVALEKPESLRIDDIEEFQSAFSQLEEKLGAVGERIEAYTERAASEGALAASQLLYWMTAVVVGGILSGVVLSLMVVRSIRKGLGGVVDRLSLRGTETRRMNASIEQLAKRVADATNTQAAAAQESVASITEISSMVSRTGEGALESMQNARAVTEKTERGKKIMNDLVAAMEGINDANRQLNEMAAIIQEISVKTSVINDIVFKTQLLSFNASIEAARAGQHGRGFAVVAEEVGSLAELSGNAAREIESLLQGSNQQVKQMVEITAQRVSQGQAVSREAMETFSQIATDVRLICDSAERINEATREQELGIQQTQIAMKQIDSGTQETSSVASQVLGAVARMRSQTEELAGVIATLNLMTFGKPNVSEAGEARTPTRVIAWDDAEEAPEEAWQPGPGDQGSSEYRPR